MHSKSICAYVLGLILLFLSVIGTLLIPAQSDFYNIIIGVVLSFVGYILLFPSFSIKERFTVLLVIGIGLRIIFVFSMPNLSNDIFRFAWDGLLLQEGMHPFLYTPDQIMEFDMFQSDKAYYLYERLNSQGYYSIYPPLCQLSFYISTLVNPFSIANVVVVFKLLFLLCEFGSFFFVVKILQHLGQNPGNVFYYVFNPLVIIELFGNIHFELMMVTFMAGCIYFILSNRLLLAGIFFASAIATKLLPLMFLPVILYYLYIRKENLVTFISSVLVSCVLLFVPLFYSTWRNLLASVDLYFQKFEFNASIYYLMRKIFAWITGYNQIWIIGPALGIIALFLILKISMRKFKDQSTQLDLLNKMLWIFVVYLLLATTIHPWYLGFLLLVNVFFRYTFIWVWSLLIFLSYSAYDSQPFQEHSWLLFVEYAITCVVLVWELKISKSANQPLLQFLK